VEAPPFRTRRARSTGPLLLALACAAAPAGATGFLAYERSQSCLECHVQWGGGGGLNERGEEARARGFRFARDPALVLEGAFAPLTEGGAAMLEKRYRDLGKRLFHLKAVGRIGRACQDCHAPTGRIATAFPRYPAFRDDLERWVSLEGAINDCLTSRVRTAPLADASRSMVGLVSYLKSLHPRVHPTLGAHEDAPGTVTPEEGSASGSGDGGMEELDEVDELGEF